MPTRHHYDLLESENEGLAENLVVPKGEYHRLSPLSALIQVPAVFESKTDCGANEPYEEPTHNPNEACLHPFPESEFKVVFSDPIRFHAAALILIPDLV
jgi:hypothetical protein